MENKLVITSVVLVLLLGAFLFISRRPSYVEIEGRVYERFDSTKASPIALSEEPEYRTTGIQHLRPLTV